MSEVILKEFNEIEEDLYKVIKKIEDLVRKYGDSIAEPYCRHVLECGDVNFKQCVEHVVQGFEQDIKTLGDGSIIWKFNILINMIQKIIDRKLTQIDFLAFTYESIAHVIATLKKIQTITLDPEQNYVLSHVILILSKIGDMIYNSMECMKKVKNNEHRS